MRWLTNILVKAGACLFNPRATWVAISEENAELRDREMMDNNERLREVVQQFECRRNEAHADQITHTKQAIVFQKSGSQAKALSEMRIVLAKKKEEQDIRNQITVLHEQIKNTEQMVTSRYARKALAESLEYTNKAVKRSKDSKLPSIEQMLDDMSDNKAYIDDETTMDPSLLDSTTLSDEDVMAQFMEELGDSDHPEFSLQGLEATLANLERETGIMDLTAAPTAEGGGESGVEMNLLAGDSDDQQQTSRPHRSRVGLGAVAIGDARVVSREEFAAKHRKLSSALERRDAPSVPIHEEEDNNDDDGGGAAARGRVSSSSSVSEEEDEEKNVSIANVQY